MTITEFLLARIEEDEEAARAAQGEGAYPHYADTAAGECVEMAKSEGCSEEGYRYLRRWLPERVLAECAAKRRIAEWDAEQYVAYSPIKYLASVYASHPDYRDEWQV